MITIKWWVWPSWLRRQIVVLKIVGSNPITHPIYAGMAELADALDLGSSVIDVGVQVLFPAPIYKRLRSFFYCLFFRIAFLFLDYDIDK